MAASYTGLRAGDPTGRRQFETHGAPDSPVPHASSSSASAVGEPSVAAAAAAVVAVQAQASLAASQLMSITLPERLPIDRLQLRSLVPRPDHVGRREMRENYGHELPDVNTDDYEFVEVCVSMMQSSAARASPSRPTNTPPCPSVLAAGRVHGDGGRRVPGAQRVMIPPVTCLLVGTGRIQVSVCW